jgi:hypothetical protein
MTIPARTFWMALAIAVLAIPVTLLNWPNPPPDQGPPSPLTIEGAKGLDDSLLVTYTSRDILWQMMGKDQALDAWRQAPEPAKHIYVLATGGRALNTCGLLDWCIQQQTRGELPTLAEIAASYTAIGLSKIAALVSSATLGIPATAAHGRRPLRPRVGRPHPDAADDRRDQTAGSLYQGPCRRAACSCQSLRYHPVDEQRPGTGWQRRRDRS